MTPQRAFSERIPADRVRAIRPRLVRQERMGAEEFHRAVREALRSNRVSDDQFVRGEWCRMLEEAAEILSGTFQHARWDGAGTLRRHGLFGLSVKDFSEHHMPGTSYSVYDAAANAAAFVRKTVFDLELDPDNVDHVRSARLRREHPSRGPLTCGALDELLAKRNADERQRRPCTHGY